MQGLFKRITLFLFSFVLLPTISLAQNEISGLIQNAEGTPLAGASVKWKGTQVGVIADTDGKFSLDQHPTADSLVFSFVGYASQTRLAKSKMRVKLQEGETLSEVEIVKRQKSTLIKRMDPLKTEIMVEKELLKAACCNLSESFETSPSVDVSYTDAVTGTRQIQMLGLAGPYTQITRENIPSVRALNAVSGLTYIPGPWLSSIQLNKGAGSVVNGFESITGQINYELQKPLDTDPLFLNLYANQGGRMEANIHGTTTITDKIATAILIHGKSNQQENDRNQDGFLDMPTGENLILFNRWFFMGNNGWRFQVGGKYTDISNQGGDFENSEAEDNWQYLDDHNRKEVFAKAGKVFDLPWKSMGFQTQYVNHSQEVFAGFTNVFQAAVLEPRYSINGISRLYNAEQQSLYANFIYQSIISNTNNEFKTGLSYQADWIDEQLNGNLYQRQELVPGAFFELNKTWSENFKTVSGIRVDYHNNYGAFVTPRLHGWWAISDNSTFRFSGGRGLRTANIFADNFGQWASTRSFQVLNTNNGNPYGLNPEIAWNYGVNFTQYFNVFERDLQLALDFYRTDFENQVVVDRDQDDGVVYVYNLNGSSFANSFQVQADYELIKRLDIRLAYRWYDVQTNFSGALLQQPFLSKHRAFINTAYETDNKWFFDATLNWIGEQRLTPFFEDGNKFSPDFFTVNAQVRKVWPSKFELYAGVENLFNFSQDNPVSFNSRDPQSNLFGSVPEIDAASVWGPIFGRNIYVGLRYRLQ